jgi:hypothetical protein
MYHFLFFILVDISLGKEIENKTIYYHTSDISHMGHYTKFKKYFKNNYDFNDVQFDVLWYNSLKHFINSLVSKAIGIIVYEKDIIYLNKSSYGRQSIDSLFKDIIKEISESKNSLNILRQNVDYYLQYMSDINKTKEASQPSIKYKNNQKTSNTFSISDRFQCKLNFKDIYDMTNDQFDVFWFTYLSNIGRYDITFSNIDKKLFINTLNYNKISKIFANIRSILTQVDPIYVLKQSNINKYNEYIQYKQQHEIDKLKQIISES